MFDTIMDLYGEKTDTPYLTEKGPTVPLAVWTRTLVWIIWAVGMVSVTNWLVSFTVKWWVWFTDTSLTIRTSLSWLPRLVKPMCRLKMCSTVSSSRDVVTEIHVRMRYCHQCCKATVHVLITCNYCMFILLIYSIGCIWKWCFFFYFSTCVVKSLHNETWQLNLKYHFQLVTPSKRAARKTISNDIKHALNVPNR